MNNYEDLLWQLHGKKFNPMNFTVYNFIEDDGYVKELSALKHETFTMDDFEFMILSIPDDDKKGIKIKNRSILQHYIDFKYYIEKECQDIPQCGIFIMKDLGIIVAVKLKSYNIATIKEV